MRKTLMYYIRLDHQVIVEKIRSINIVCENAPYLGGSQEYILRFFCFKKSFYIRLFSQIKLDRGSLKLDFRNLQR